MPVKLPFTVVGCSGEDPEFPVSELLYHSSDSKGWCTPRFCQYPQDLTLRLEQPARLAQVQLLSHEFKIAAKLELLVGTFESAGPVPPQGADPSKAAWRRLGFLSFDSNERSSFTARELKSVALNGTPAHLLRLVFHRCHTNVANKYGQVGLVAINLMGDPLMPLPLAPITNTAFGVPPGVPGMAGGMPPGAMPPPGMLQQPPPQQLPPQQQVAGPPPQQQQPHQHLRQQQLTVGPNPAEAVAALAAELGVDSVTAQRIAEMQQQKQQAVEREDYDEAKRLKAAVDRLKAAGGAIAQMEARKRAAVEEEDYDLAKQLKLEIDRMRNSVYAAALSSHAGGRDPSFSPPRSRRTSTRDPSPPRAAASRRPSGDEYYGGSRRREEREADGPGQQRGQPRADDDPDTPPAAAAGRLQLQPPGGGGGGGGAANNDWSSYDDRPAQAKGAYNFQNADESSTPATRRATGGGGRAPAGRPGSNAKASDALPAPPGFPADLPAPEALSAADAKDAGPLIDLLGEYMARSMFSKTWQLREAALALLAKDLGAGKPAQLDGSSDAFKTITRLLQRTIKDKVAAVFSASLGTLRALVAAQAGKCSGREVQAAVGELLPLLVEKAADLNQRTREQATEALVTLAGVPEAGLGSSTGPFLRLPKPNTAWKIVLGRLQLVSALLPVIGMASRSRDGFELESLMDFINPAFSNSSNEVRGAAISLTLQIAQLAGPSVQRLLPADLNAKVKEQIQQGLLNPSAALASGPARPPAAAKQPGSGRQPAAAAAAAPAQQQAPGGSRQAAAQQQQQQQAAVARPASTAQSMAVVPAQLQSTASPAPAAAAAGAMQPLGAGDEVAVHEAEVRAREARLGPAHPDVADAIINLATLHNQLGNVAKALPLYERALAIWEASAGPNSPDVAHTLTDIAVIHLEQGRDDIGRPLLERALRIQEAHLGPNHPDVVAIRDVLEEEV